MENNTKPIGIFDSGFGGLSVLQEALFALPQEDFLYYGDNKNAPYGDKPEHEITRLAFCAAHELTKRGAKAMVVACNTATSAAIRGIRQELDIPVVSMEPAIKPACELPGNGKVLMCATLATTRLERYLALQARMKDPERVINVPCPGIPEMVESFELDKEAYQPLLKKLLGAYDRQEIDAIVLGCTHYVFIKDAFLQYAKENFLKIPVIIDGNAATVRQLERVLKQEGLANDQGTGNVEFLSSGDAKRLKTFFWETSKKTANPLQTKTNDDTISCG